MLYTVHVFSEKVDCDVPIEWIWFIFFIFLGILMYCQDILLDYIQNFLIFINKIYIIFKKKIP